MTFNSFVVLMDTIETFYSSFVLTGTVTTLNTSVILMETIAMIYSSVFLSGLSSLLMVLLWLGVPTSWIRQVEVDQRNLLR